MIVRDEEICDVLDNSRLQTFHRSRRRFAGFNLEGNGDEAVIAFGFTVFGLFRLNNAEESGVNQAAGERRFIRQNEHVQWVAIFARSRRYEAEIKWKGVPHRQGFIEHEHAVFFVVFEFRVTALRSLDNYVHVLRLRAKRMHVRNVVRRRHHLTLAAIIVP